MSQEIIVKLADWSEENPVPAGGNALNREQHKAVRAFLEAVSIQVHGWLEKTLLKRLDEYLTGRDRRPFARKDMLVAIKSYTATVPYIGCQEWSYKLWEGGHEKEKYRNIDFNNKGFVLTGDFAFGVKSELREKIEEAGGVVFDDLMAGVDYLVVGEFRCRADNSERRQTNKIRSAIDRRRTSGKPAIVPERLLIRELGIANENSYRISMPGKVEIKPFQWMSVYFLNRRRGDERVDPLAEQAVQLGFDILRKIVLGEKEEKDAGKERSNVPARLLVSLLVECGDPESEKSKKSRKHPVRIVTLEEFHDILENPEKHKHDILRRCHFSVLDRPRFLPGFKMAVLDAFFPAVYWKGAFQTKPVYFEGNYNFSVGDTVWNTRKAYCGCETDETHGATGCKFTWRDALKEIEYGVQVVQAPNIVKVPQATAPMRILLLRPNKNRIGVDECGTALTTQQNFLRFLKTGDLSIFLFKN